MGGFVEKVSSVRSHGMFPTMTYAMNRWIYSRFGKTKSHEMPSAIPDPIRIATQSAARAVDLVATDWVAGSFMVIHRDLFTRLGGFDEKYFMYFEDLDLCQRARREGERPVVVRDWSHEHPGHFSYRNEPGRQSIDYRESQSRYLNRFGHPIHRLLYSGYRRMRYWLHTFKFIVCAIVLVSSHAGPGRADPPPFSQSTLDLVRSRPPSARPLKGLAAIGDFHLKKGDPRHALKIFRYAMIHDPTDPTIQARIRETLEVLANREGAQNSVEGQDLQPGESPSATQVGQDNGESDIKLLDVAASPETTEAAGIDGEPQVIGDENESLRELAELLPGANLVQMISRLDNSKLDSDLLSDQNKALKYLKAFAAVIKIFEIRNPKVKPEDLTLEALFESDAMPEGLINDRFPAVSIEEGVPSLESFGTIEKLQDALGEYRKMLETIARYSGNGRSGQAYRIAKKMIKTYPDDPGALDQLLNLQMSLRLDYEAVHTAERLAMQTPGDPHTLTSLDRLFYDTGAYDRALKLARIIESMHEGSFYALSAQAIRSLIEDQVTVEEIDDLIRVGKEIAASEGVTITVEEP